MEDYAIEIDHVTIRFNMASEKVDNLKEYIIKLIKKELIFQEFLAVKDVSFKIKRGEAWALIGMNGSGKSTLLKAISGILKPYKGSITVHGEIAPLIELGAGFDSNLTARENIYLNGTVLGHSKKFMDDHFDEIVDFAELHDFLDTPIKNFSSGMSARLGFSIATMVKPEILIVDEILAVGDFLFQQKCMERMSHMLEGGTTLLFVSHNIETVKNFVIMQRGWIMAYLKWREKYRLSVMHIWNKENRMIGESMTKVSVIVPIYNMEVYVKECLDSILRQTLKEIEVVCIDDGSTDRSWEILAEYAKADARILPIRQENLGVSTARNNGIKKASGKYLILWIQMTGIQRRIFWRSFLKKQKKADVIYAVGSLANTTIERERSGQSFRNSILDMCFQMRV